MNLKVLQENKDMIIVYLNPETSVSCPKKSVSVGDVTEVYCKNKSIRKKIQSLPLMRMDDTDHKKYVISTITLIACIDASLNMPVVIQNIGASEIVVTASPKKSKKLIVFGKVALVMLITFFGSIFAIMTYNEDVDVTGVFDKVYWVITGAQRTGPGLLEVFYGIGVASGIIIFFNHFGRKKLTKEPTPMEIEMEKYETDITNTVVKEASRTKQVMDITKE